MTILLVNMYFIYFKSNLSNLSWDKASYLRRCARDLTFNKGFYMIEKFRSRAHLKSV